MRALVASVVLCFACAAPSAERAVPEGLDLVGTWYVLVQHRAIGAADGDAFSVEDAVWRFERDGDRLRWTLFAAPIHEEGGGAIDPGTGPLSAARVEETLRGMEVTRRDALEKTLEGSDASGWRSKGGGAPASASALAFGRELRIEGLPEHPVFTRLETLGGYGAEGLGGLTRYEAREVAPDHLAGRYERDGERVGRFAMWRIASVRVRE